MKKIILINIIACISVFFGLKAVSVIKVQGDSMMGIVDDKSRIITISPHKIFNPIRRGDVITFRYGAGRGKMDRTFVKKVAGIPGDTCYTHVVFEDYKKYIIINSEYIDYYYNNQEAKDFFENIDEKYWGKNDYQVNIHLINEQFFVVGSDEFWIGSTDSRVLGFIDKKSISGKVAKIIKY